MYRKSSNVFAATALVLHRYGLIAVLAVLAACGHRAGLDSDLEEAIPAGAAIVAEANLNQLRGTPLWRAVPQGLLEPFGQASRLLAAEERNEWLVLARGNLAQAPAGGRWLAPGLAAAGSERLVAEAAGRRGSIHQASPVVTFARAHAAGSALWIAARGGVDLPLSGNYANLNRLLRDVEYVCLSARLAGNCRLQLTAESGSEAGAERFEQTLRAMLSLAAMAEARHEELAGALNRAVVRRDGNRINAELSGSLETVAKLLGQAPR